MLSRLLRTDNDVAATAARLALGVVIFPHGAQKALGWFGGGGFESNMAGFQSMGIPLPFAFLAIVAEFAGSIGLMLGCLTRVAAFGIGCNMVFAALLVSRPYGFFMNWYGTQQGEGYEFHVLAIGLALVLMIRGGGALSVDRASTSATGRLRSGSSET
jgi:putative oxidoreductase